MPIPVADLVRAAVPLFGVSERDIIEPARFPHIYRARAAVCLAAQLSGRQYSDIGRTLGDRHHTAIKHACTRAEQMAEADPDYSAQVDQLSALARAWAVAHTQELLSRHQAREIMRKAQAAA